MLACTMGCSSGTFFIGKPESESERFATCYSFLRFWQLLVKLSWLLESNQRITGIVEAKGNELMGERIGGKMMEEGRKW